MHYKYPNQLFICLNKQINEVFFNPQFSNQQTINQLFTEETTHTSNKTITVVSIPLILHRSHNAQFKLLTGSMKILNKNNIHIGCGYLKINTHNLLHQKNDKPDSICSDNLFNKLKGLFSTKYYFD
jgi:hypothetical protein